ncbi:unnamed protein product [marine sediment metagenome]|uniref:Uncharacterized protein n=1 Tax=marine sediment metagenome TaxID=412755 RepID=X1R531_9ZZZZ
MLKWKRIAVTAEDGYEQIEDALAGMSGKDRVIKYLGETNHFSGSRLRVYRDADQIVDLDAYILTAEAPFLPMDLPLAEGQLCKIGVENNIGAKQLFILVIGYTETG